MQEHKLGLSHVLSDMPSGNGRRRMDDVWAKLIDKTDETIENLVRITDTLDLELRVIHDALDKLPPPERMILTARHIRGMSFNEIQKEINYSERTMYTLYGRGLKNLECPFTMRGDFVEDVDSVTCAYGGISQKDR